MNVLRLVEAECGGVAFVVGDRTVEHQSVHNTGSPAGSLGGIRVGGARQE
jgi:hypothetical protein